MAAPYDIHPAIRKNLVSMLDTLAINHGSGEMSDEEYFMTLKYLRFRIGEDLFEKYASPHRTRTVAGQCAHTV
jgi:hypothetical protein